MERDVQALLSGLLEDDTLAADRAAELARALDTPDAAAEIQADLQTEILLRQTLAREGNLVRSRDRLLAKAVLRERGCSLRRARRARPVMLAWAAAAAIAVVAAAAAWVWHTRLQRPGMIVAQGDFTVLPAGDERPRPGSAPRRGDRVVAGPGGVRLGLGGYCELAMDGGTEVVVRGEAQKEVVQIDVGRLVSKVRPGRGSYTVLTPAGTLEVKGTEFVTTVGYENRKEADVSSARRALVTVLVYAGVVGFDVGGEQGLIRVGGSRAFAAEVGGTTGPQAQSQTKTGVVRRVDLEGKAILVMVARELAFTITDTTEIREGDTPRTLADIKVGQTVDVVYSFDPDRNRIASKVTITNPAAPAERPQEPEGVRSQTKTGTVRRVDPEAKTIVVMVARELPFTVTDKTEIKEHDAPRAMADIHVGDTVSVLYSFDPGRNRIASKVIIVGRDQNGAGVPKE